MKKLLQSTAMISCLFLFSTVVMAQVSRSVFVRPDGQGDGTSWSMAYGTLTEALLVARAGDEIWVAAGTYLPSQQGNRSQSFQIPEGVRLFGGFRGMETELAARDFRENRTILSGNIGDTSDVKDNSFSVVKFSSVTAATVIDGFVIRDGQAKEETVDVRPDNCGAGIFVEEASPTIRNCVLEDNQAVYGAGLYVYARDQRSAPMLINCTFFNNTATLYGGGICNNGLRGSCVPTLKACRLVLNQALYGAGIANLVDQGNYLLRLEGCHFQDNFADLRHSVIYFEPKKAGQGELQFENCYVSGNSSTIGREEDERPFKKGSGVLVY